MNGSLSMAHYLSWGIKLTENSSRVTLKTKVSIAFVRMRLHSGIIVSTVGWT